jgi:hypothetical protein
MYLSKLEAQLVTSTLSEKILWGDSGVPNQNFDIGISQTLILYARSIFLQGSHLLEILRKKIFFVKTLSKLGALTVFNLCYFLYSACLHCKTHPSDSLASSMLFIQRSMNGVFFSPPFAASFSISFCMSCRKCSAVLIYPIQIEFLTSTRQQL